MKNFFNFANQLVNRASSYILNNYEKKKIYYKKGHFNLVTNIDKEVEELIVREIKKHFEDHSIIAEESGLHNENKKYKWFIDPIDGTTNFAHGFPMFCISIALAYEDEIIVGVVKNPVTGEHFSAMKNEGATLNKRPIHVSKIKKLSESLLVTGFPHDAKKFKVKNFNRFKKLTLNSHGVRRIGSAAIDLCYVASGRLEAFWEERLSPWDTAAGVLILEEAGGKITNFKNKKYDIYQKEILATNGLVHKELLQYF